MNNQVIQAFFLGRALAAVVGEKLEDAFTNALSDLGKFDAEQRENLRQFVQEVQARAEREMDQGNYSTGNNSTNNKSGSEDLQETLDELRAEIARLRSELKNYHE